MDVRHGLIGIRPRVHHKSVAGIGNPFLLRYVGGGTHHAYSSWGSSGAAPGGAGGGGGGSLAIFAAGPIQIPGGLIDKGLPEGLPFRF